MRLGLPSFNSLSKFCLEMLPAVVAIAVVGYLLSYLQADRADGALPAENVVQSTRASEIEEARNDRAMMRDVIRSRRIAEEQAVEQAREAKIAAEQAAAMKAVAPVTAAQDSAPLPPVRRVAHAPTPRSEAKAKPKPAAEAKATAAPLPITPPIAENAPPPVEESRGPVMYVVDKAGELGRKTVATTGEAVAWVVSLPASLMGVKRIFGDSPPPPQQNGHILKGS
jgi:FtsZ-interacting cell division protein ZipA